jgi:transmembrane sensor
MKALVPYQEELEQNFRVAYLISHFIQENLSEEEELELDYWVQQSDHNMKIFEDMTDESVVEDFMKWYAERDTERSLQEVKQRLQFLKPKKRVLIWRYAAAASIILLLGAGLYYFVGNDNQKKEPVVVENRPSDIAPGKAYATLTLANGQQIILSNLKDTVINSNVSVRNGVVIYSDVAGEPEYHEITIPRKGFYQLVLPDGSKVWVNSSSSIRYPSRFSGKERRVSVSGETYFEIAKDAIHPFIVSVNGTDITAIGTAFNINAYPNEDGLRITLTEGKIKVGADSKVEQLEPGQQLMIVNDQWNLSAIDTSPIIAWTKNQFKLKNTTIEEAMRMAERWYDAKIIYKDKITDHFTGTIDRSVPVSHLLKLLEATGQVHFRIEGDTIIVTR